MTCALDELQKPDAAVGGDAVGGEAHKVRRCCCCSALWLEWRWWRRRPGWATDCSCDSALDAADDDDDADAVDGLTRTTATGCSSGCT